jgi:uncharacterized RDD family membrane protein YckC
MNWYYVEQGKQAGPVNDEQLDERLRSGRITDDTLAWHEGMADWKPYKVAKGGMISGGTIGTVGGAEVVCAECGKIFPVDETIRYGDVRVCAACKPVFLQKLQEGALLSTGDVRYAGFWIRVAAKIIDGLIIGVPLMVVMVIVIFALIHPGARQTPSDTILPGMITPLLQIVFFGVQMAYQIFFLGKYGATPGKMACSIKVITADGGNIGYGRATGRFFSEILSALICYIGYIIVAFDDQKRALHDHICNTRVVYK